MPDVLNGAILQGSHDGITWETIPDWARPSFARERWVVVKPAESTEQTPVAPANDQPTLTANPYDREPDDVETIRLALLGLREGPIKPRDTEELDPPKINVVFLD